jgi:Hsp20/alpha crystallin family
VDAGDRLDARERQSGRPRRHSRIKPEKVKIEVEDDILTVSGEHEERTEKRDKHYLRRNRRYGSFSRSMALPRRSGHARVRRQAPDLPPRRA